MPFDAQSEISDDILLARYASGDGQAAMLLTHRLTPRVLGYATRILADRTEAEDVAQDAMLRLWKMAPDWREGEAQVSTWLYRVVANLCTDRLRKRRFSALDEGAEIADTAPGAEARLQTKARHLALMQAMDELPDRQRLAVQMRHLEGFSNPEIAAAMNIGVEAVESLTARGKRALTLHLAARKTELGYNDG